MYGYHTLHGMFSNYILCIMYLLDVTRSFLYLQLKDCDEEIDNRTCIPDVILKVEFCILLTRLS